MPPGKTYSNTRKRRRVYKARGLDDAAYRKATRRLREQGGPCWLCGADIDPSLPYTDPMSWTADHIIPRSRGGALLGEMRPAHRSCNAKRGNKPVEKSQDLPWTRDWLPGIRSADHTVI